MGRVADIRGSFGRLPFWVRLWVVFVLVPVNLASLWYWKDVPWVALLAVGGMAANLFIMLGERGLSRAMALPHLVSWVPLVFVIAFALRAGAAGELRAYLWVLLAVDLLSLGFDFPDALRWWRGEREVA